MSKNIKTALISVYDKSKLKLLLKSLNKYKIKFISSGGTYKEIKKLGYKCTEVSKFTKSKEILDGRVKTLHPKIHAGILSKKNKRSHMDELRKNNFEKIELVIVNFYPFDQTLKQTNNHQKIIEKIDIGGPALVRAAAKNYQDVTVITNTGQYDDLVGELNKNNGSTSLEFRMQLSLNAFTETGCYDSSISNYFNKKTKNFFPKKKLFYANLIEKLRYGENPHQEGALYSFNKYCGINQLQGKKLSYNNYNDIFSAISISRSLPKNVGTVVVKHANPSGVSINKNKIKSFELALKCDPISAYGGIVSCNFAIDKKMAKELNKIYLEVVIGIGISKEALNEFKMKKNLRVIDSTKFKIENFENINTSYNNMLVQSPDLKSLSRKDFKVVSKTKPNKKSFKNLIFAFNICRFVKSNAIVIVKEGSTVGIGSGQPSRIDSCKIAISKMKNFHKNLYKSETIAASDAFFPFADGPETLVHSGVSAIVQPSGSIRDKEIIKFANQAGIVLVFSKTRHFKH